MRPAASAWQRVHWPTRTARRASSFCLCLQASQARQWTPWLRRLQRPLRGTRLHRESSVSECSARLVAALRARWMRRRQARGSSVPAQLACEGRLHDLRPRPGLLESVLVPRVTAGPTMRRRGGKQCWRCVGRRWKQQWRTFLAAAPPSASGKPWTPSRKRHSLRLGCFALRPWSTVRHCRRTSTCLPGQLRPLCRPSTPSQPRGLCSKRSPSSAWSTTKACPCRGTLLRQQTRRPQRGPKRQPPRARRWTIRLCSTSPDAREAAAVRGLCPSGPAGQPQPFRPRTARGRPGRTPGSSSRRRKSGR